MTFDDYGDPILPVDAKLIYNESYADYSFGEMLLIWEQGGEYFFWDDTGEAKTISGDEALQLMIDFDEIVRGYQ